MKYFKKLIGEKIYLSPINVEDYPIYTKWLNDENMTKYLTLHDSIVSLTNEKTILEQLANKEFVFAIIKADNDELIGNIGLENINYKNGTASLGIFIGEENNLSKGYGSEAIKLLVNFAFKNLRIHNIMLEVFEDNTRAIKAYNKCGFKEFGRRKEAIYRDGRYYDLVYMEIINK